MAEFWWGAEPKSAIRKHKHFYPSCQGKCFPILNHMLIGLAVDENPLLKNLAKDKEIVLVCGAGGMAALTGKTLVEMGYTQIKNVGAIGDWIEAGGPTEK